MYRTASGWLTRPAVIGAGIAPPLTITCAEMWSTLSLLSDP
jgi:hypothetical protein